MANGSTGLLMIDKPLGFTLHCGMEHVLDLPDDVAVLAGETRRGMSLPAVMPCLLQPIADLGLKALQRCRLGIGEVEDVDVGPPQRVRRIAHSASSRSRVKQVVQSG